MTNKYSMIALWMIFATLPGFCAAQASKGSGPADKEPYEGSAQERVITALDHLWLLSENAASLGLFQMPDYGTTQVGGSLECGDFHRIQEPAKIQKIDFSSESFKSLRNLNLWGKFTYSQAQHTDKNFADRMNPYDGNPYSSGSPITGDYGEQLFGLYFKLSSRKLFNFMYAGLSAAYRVGDYSRQNDPRPRINYGSYGVTPSLLIPLSPKSQVGIDGFYRFEKEKLGEVIAKSNSVASYDYYVMKGMGEYTLDRAVSFRRRYKNNYYGGHLQYGFRDRMFALLAQGGCEYRHDQVEGDTKKSPGSYNARKFDGLLTANLRRGQSLQNVTCTYQKAEGWAKEFLQEYVQADRGNGILSYEWETIFSAVRYRDYREEAALDYKYYGLGPDARDYRWYAGVGMRYSSIETRFIEPYSQMTLAKTEWKFEGGVSLLNAPKYTHSLLVNASVSYLTRGNNSLILNPMLADLGNDVIQNGVVIPDFTILNQELLGWSVEVQYSFPLQRKVAPIRGFVSLYGKGYQASGGVNRMLCGVSIGILTY